MNFSFTRASHIQSAAHKTKAKHPVFSAIHRTVSSCLTVVLICAFSISVKAQCKLLNETFNVNPVLFATDVDGKWYPDRYPSAAFVSDVLSGSNVLRISIDGVNDGAASRPPSYVSSFYNTQGRKFNQCGGCITVLKGDLWIPADWATKHRRSDMWATAYDITNTTDPSAYPIIGFRNTDAASPGIYYYDVNTGLWIDSGVPILYNNWYRLEFRLSGTNLEYLVNNVVVGTLSSNGSTYFANIIMQAYNFNDAALPATSGTPDLNPSTNSYDAYWDNLITTGTGGNVVTNTNTGETFCTIQAAIDDADTDNGHIISVSAGTYNEQVNVNKSVTIRGANFGTAGYASRVSESIVSGDNGDHACFLLQADNAIVDGFKVTGGGGSSYNSGVWFNPTNTGMQLLNSIVTDNVIGAYPQSTGTTAVKHNLFDGNNRSGAAGGSGIYVENSKNLTIDDNEFKNHLNNSAAIFTATAAGAHTNLIFTRNYIHDNNADNSMVYCVGINGGAFNENRITQPGTRAIKFAGACTSINVLNNTLDNNGIGIKIQDDGFGLGSNSSINIHFNSLNQCSEYFIENLEAINADASCNWYGSTNNVTVASKIAGSVTYIPYLLNGTDNSAAIGFQPLPNNCAGGIPKLKTSMNGVIVNADNDGNDDNGSFATCNTTDNILFNSFTDQNGLADPLLRVYQTFTATNVTVPFCNDCWATMAAFAGVTGTAALINPALPGVLTIRFRSWVDTDNDQTIDPSELASDWIEYIITVTASPAITPLTVTQPTCAAPTGKIVVNATGSGTLEYSINGGTTWSPSNTFNSLAPGNYNIAVRLQSSPYCSANYGSNPVVLLAATGCSNCTLTCPPNMVVNNKPGQCGAYVSYPAATKTGTCGSLTYTKASGSWFLVGTTTVTVTSPSTGASCSFTVKVVDNQKPDINCPSNIVVNAATNSCSKVVNYSVSVTDNCPGAITVTSVPASGSVFNTGTTTVYVTATDAAGNISTSSFTVTVKETKPPVITCPVNITVNAEAGLCKAMIDPGTATATDNCPGVITITGKRSDNKALNAYYPLGVTTITWKAKDASGNESTCQQKITVKDIQPPVITNVSVNPAVLWPADHSMKTVTVNYTSTDNCGPDDNCSSGVCYLSVTSNEPISGTGNGDLSPDWQIIDAHKVKLRAERNPNGAGRIYTIKITCVDAAGNSSFKTITVSVPLTAPPANKTMAPAEETYTIAEKVISTGLTAQVMPNPAEREFNLVIKGGSHETLEIRVFDITGREVQRIRNAASTVIRFGDKLMQGTYIVEVRQGKDKVVLKALKQ